MAAAEVTEIGLHPNEFEVELGTLGRLRGRVDVSAIHEIERRTGQTFMEIAMSAANGAVGFVAVCVMCEVMLRRVLGAATPTKDEIESGVFEAGVANVARSLHRPLLRVLNGAGA